MSQTFCLQIRDLQRPARMHELIVFEMISPHSLEIIRTKSKREYTLNSNARGHIIHGNKSLTMEGIEKIIA